MEKQLHDGAARRILILGLATLLLVSLPGPARSGSTNALSLDYEAQDCDEYVPERAKIIVNPGPSLSLDVIVLLDGPAKSEAEEVIVKAGRAYAPLNLTLTASYKKVTLQADPGSQPPASSATAILSQAKELLTGMRPAGSDLVLVLTNKDLYLSTQDVVGYADCIGGIRYPDRAFAVAEAFDQTESVGPLNFYVDLPAKTAAHEIGHLLGARHEQANCIEGNSPEDVSERQLSPCTLMSDYVDVQSMKFGTVEAGIVRAHAEAYAAA